MRQIRAAPVVLCIRMHDPHAALSAAMAAVRGGLLCIEVTMTTPSAEQVISDLIAACPNAVVGAGTVLTREHVDAARDAGACFAMSPVADADIVQYCHQNGLLAIPGAATPTECYHAFHTAGAKLVKIFPAMVCGGLDFVRAMQGPLAYIPLLPTSSVKLDMVASYLQESNVWAVGASRQVVDSDCVDRHDWDGITERAKIWVSTAATAVSDYSGLMR